MPLTAEGLTIRTLQEIKDQIVADIRANVDPTFEAEADTPDGELVAIFASHAREVEEVIQVLYEMHDPDAAEDALLDNTSALTGTLREPATRSTVTETLTLGAAFGPQAIGAMKVAVDGKPEIVFQNAVAVSSVGAGDYPFLFECTETGPIVANAGTLTEIVTPLAGWTAATNAEDATLGTDIEGDVDLRERRESEIAGQGSSSTDALRAKLLLVTDVLAAVVYENTSDTPDSAGRPAHSIEAVVHAPDVDDDDIAQVLWDHHGGGIKTFGTDSGVATDSLGNSRTMLFSRAVEREVWVSLTKHYNIRAGVVPSDTIRERILAEGRKLLVGDDVSWAKLLGAAVSTPGVTNVTFFKIGFSDPPLSTTDLAIGERDIAELDSSRIDITDPYL